VVPPSPADGLHVRSLLALEVRAQRWPNRIVRPLAGGWLLHDPDDPEPVFNRLVDPKAPEEPASWRTWLSDIHGAFEALERRPHVWLAADPGDPRLEVLEADGFERVASGQYLVLERPERVAAVAAAALPPGVRLERVDRWSTAAGAAGRDVAAVIADAFDLEPAFRVLIEADVRQLLEVPAIAFVLARRDGEAVAAARRTTDGSATLLAAIGTRRAHRGRGFGRLVTAAVANDALALGSEMVYLAVEDGNDAAHHLYGGLGFQAAAGSSVALLRR
jgi:ribosomal protein S18 acetylase RimI-like enzyme